MRCPLCDSQVYLDYRIAKNKDESVSFGHCGCGAIFNSAGVKQAKFTAEYAKDLMERKQAKERYEYILKVYAPIVEELTYKRDFLDVGFGTRFILDAMKERGWNVDGIDLIPDNGFISGDFETYDFFGKGKDHRYDFILMGDVLQCFKNPVKAIYKAYNLLNPNGVLFCITPNTDLIRNSTIRAFGHFDTEEVNILLSYGNLRDILARCDESLTGRMDIVLSLKNVEAKRFVTWNSMHVMAQKKKIEDIPNLCDLEKSLSAAS